MSLIPSRVSSVPKLVRCPGFAALQDSGPRSSSAAADTGTAVGRLIQLHHEGHLFEDACRAALREMPEAFPRADFDQAREWTLLYAADPRNRDVVEPGSCEREVRVTLPPAPEDPTQAPVIFVGHIDQLRRVNGQLRVWDVKSGKPGGLELLYDYALQIAAYALACTETLGEEVLPGGIIRVRGYTPRGGVEPGKAKVFFESPWTLRQARQMLDTAVQHVALLRAGIVLTQPGTHCSWCPASGPHTCSDEIARVFDSPPLAQS